MPGTLFVVATPIGNLEDVSARALRVLREASIIAAEDTRRTARLLARYAIATPATSLHEHNERAKTPMILARLQRGEAVALVSDAGTPTVSDPGRGLIREALAAGIRVESIPGPSAVMAALAVSGMPADQFTFLGFPPDRSKDRKRWFERVKGLDGTLVFFEAPHRILRTLTQLKDAVGDIPIMLGRELTKAHEELVIGQISTAISATPTPKGEYTVVIDLAKRPKKAASDAPGGQAILAEFCGLTDNGQMSRRTAISLLARRHGMSTNQVYRAIEEAKKSGE